MDRFEFLSVFLGISILQELNKFLTFEVLLSICSVFFRKLQILWALDFLKEFLVSSSESNQSWRSIWWEDSTFIK